MTVIEISVMKMLLLSVRMQQIYKRLRSDTNLYTKPNILLNLFTNKKLHKFSMDILDLNVIIILFVFNSGNLITFHFISLFLPRKVVFSLPIPFSSQLKNILSLLDSLTVYQRPSVVLMVYFRLFYVI